MSEKDEERARRFCRENAIDYGDSVIEEPLAPEFAKIRAEAAAECDRIAKERYEQHQAALLSSVRWKHPEIVVLPAHYHEVKPEGMHAAEECARVIRALGVGP